MSYYEAIYIIRPDLTTEQAEKVMEQTATLYTGAGGEILRTEQWGRRQLAYTVRKHAKGYYVFHSLEGSGDMVRAVENHLNISEDVIKYIHVKVEEPTTDPTPLAEESRGEGRDGERRRRDDGENDTEEDGDEEDTSEDDNEED